MRKKPLHLTPELEWLIKLSIFEDVWRMAEAEFWRSRADDFDWAKPRLGEYQGESVPAHLSLAWNRCHVTAEACRKKAHLIETGGASWYGQEPATIQRVS